MRLGTVLFCHYAAAAAAAAAADDDEQLQTTQPRRCPIIGSPPRKVSPADNLPAKNPPALWVRGDFSGGRSYSGETFYRAGDIVMRGRRVKSVIIFSRADFSWGTF